MPHRLGYVIKLLYKSCFVISADLDAASAPLTLPAIFYDYNVISIPPARNLETELPNHIKIYKDEKAVNAISRLLNEYPSIWES